MKNLLLLLLVVSSINSLFGQVGINTSTPTKMLDVNGDMRVRTLETVARPNVAYVVATDTEGNLFKTTPLDAMYSSGIYVKSTANNLWNNVKIGGKGSRIDFIGTAEIGSGVDFSFSVFHDYGANFQMISTPVVQTGSSIGIRYSGSNAFTIDITNNGTTYNLVFTVSGTSSNNLANISVTSTNSIVVKGSFHSLIHS